MRRRLTVRTLLILIAALGLLFGVAIDRGRAQHRALAELRKYGGHARTEPNWLGRLTGDSSFVQITSVEFIGPSATDDGLRHLV